MSLLSDNIKIIRALSKETQKEFIEHFTGVTEAMQKSYESAKAEPSLLYMQELSEISGIPATRLMSERVPKSEIRIVHLSVEKVEKAEGDAGNEKNITIQSLAKSLELSAQARLEDSVSRRIEAENTRRLIAMLENQRAPKMELGNDDSKHKSKITNQVKEKQG